MFQNIKRDIYPLPILVSPPPHSTLIFYLAVSHSMLSSILVCEDGKKCILFISPTELYN